MDEPGIAPQRFLLPLAYTPRAPQPGEPFTEAFFTRRTFVRSFCRHEVALVLVDLWNLGWAEGPLVMDDPWLSTERGFSHAQRKQAIVESVIVPLLRAARGAGIQVVHANLPHVLVRYPDWEACTTPAERAEAAKLINPSPQEAAPGAAGGGDGWPPPQWVQAWQEEHRRRVYGIGTAWDKALAPACDAMDIPSPARPVAGELLAFSGDQLHRLLRERRIRVLFYAGFEADECLQFKPYGMANMSQRGYLCCVIREATTTYETAETLAGLWRTRYALDYIESRWGYSVAAGDLLRAWGRAARV